MAVFNGAGRAQNQLFITRDEDTPITAEQLLEPCERRTHRSSGNARANIRVAVQYIEAWICGNGCVYRFTV